MLSAALLLLSASLASAVSVENVPAPSLLARARAAGPKNYVPRGGCSSLKYSPGKISYDLPAWDADAADVYRYRQQQSVNLGSWFVHEKWMVPSVFECAGGAKGAEIDIAAGTNAKAVLENQWDTFITEDDFAWLEKVGINTVRLPLGFWSLGPDYTKGSIFDKYGDVYENSWDRVLRGIGWAAKHNIGVLADLHGAYGSQNGQDHSGVSDGKVNFFSNSKNQDMTVDALVYMTKQLVNVTNVVGIQILNEPKNDQSLPDFYDRAIKAMRAVPGAEQFPLYVHDGFDISRFSKYVGQRDDFTVVDHHSYFVFNDAQKSTPVTGLTSQIKSSVSDNISGNTKTARGNLVVDEWGCALADGSTHVSDLKSATKAYCQGQESVYREGAAGYAFWSYMMDGCKEGDGNGWCFKGAAGNLLPSKFFSYSSQSSATGAPNGGSSNSTSSSSSSSSGDDNSDDTSDDSGNTDDGSSSSSVTTTSSSATATASQAAASGASSCKASTRKRATHSRRRHHQKAVERSNPIGHSGAKTAKRHHLVRASKNNDDSGSTSSQGYQDGLALAKKFAESGSKIGFAKQYIADKGPKNDDSYGTDFLNGIADGEAAHDKALRRRR